MCCLRDVAGSVAEPERPESFFNAGSRQRSQGRKSEKTFSGVIANFGAVVGAKVLDHAGYSE